MKITFLSSLCFISLFIGCGHLGINRDEIRLAIQSHNPDYQQCYNDLLKRDKNAQGKVMLGWTILGDGHAHDVHVIETNVKDEKFSKCLMAVVGKTQFPKPPSDQIAKVDFPFFFTAEENLKK